MVLGEPALPGVECALVKLEVLLVAVLVHRHDVVGRSGGGVEPLGPDFDLGGLGDHLKDPDNARRDRPRVAEDGLLLAVEIADRRGIRHESKLGGRLVEDLLNVVAAAWDLTSDRANDAEGMEQISIVPKHVLLPPVVKSQKSSGVVLPGWTKEYRVSFQFFRVRTCMFMEPALASAAPTGSVPL